MTYGAQNNWCYINVILYAYKTCNVNGGWNNSKIYGYFTLSPLYIQMYLIFLSLSLFLSYFVI